MQTSTTGMVSKTRAVIEQAQEFGRRNSGVLPKAQPLSVSEEMIPHQRFLERVLERLQRALPCDSAFCIIQAARARLPSGWRAAREGDAPIRCDAPLPRLLGMRSDDELPKSHKLTDLGATNCPQLAEFCLKIGISGVRFISVLYYEGRCVGVLGLERDDDFTDAECQQLEHLSAFINASAASETKAADLQCEAAILRALGPGRGIDLLFDREAQRITWSSHADVDSLHGLALTEATLATVLDEFCAAQARGDVVLALPQLPVGSLIAAAELETATPVGGRCTALRVRAEQSGVSARLSSRECEVAELLVNGFAPANIAALTNLSEPTIRTYIRRMYKKLGVCNRAALVRVLLQDGL